MPAATANLFTRSDTLFGVCEGLSEETGLPAALFRIAFALPLIFAPVLVVSLYFAIGITLLACRLLASTRSSTAG